MSSLRIVKWATVLSAFWLLLSGYIQPLLLSFGFVSVVLVLVVLKRMDAVDDDLRQVSTGLQMTRYLFWLLGQIIQSSIYVTKMIWGSPDKLSPTLAKLPVENIPPKCRVLYANSITLTPGTLCVDLEDEEITVHALQKVSIEELEEGEMAGKITSIWGENK